ncbi:hypothetical protein BGZ50_002581 [Haplosporangium sp. Z 11]|nr:hypothetical protein BGZ50_002581 [Haplosporangium sp. Z 11]
MCIEQELILDFSEPDEWRNVKLLTGGGSPQERRRNRIEALTGRIQMNVTSSVMRNYKVYFIKMTHSGRHVGVSEAYQLGLSLANIRHLGQWEIGQMEDFYASKNPIIGVFCMTHFNKKDEPCIMKRDLVTPPLELQLLIFP